MTATRRRAQALFGAAVFLIFLVAAPLVVVNEDLTLQSLKEFDPRLALVKEEQDKYFAGIAHKTAEENVVPPVDANDFSSDDPTLQFAEPSYDDDSGIDGLPGDGNGSNRLALAKANQFKELRALRAEESRLSQSQQAFKRQMQLAKRHNEEQKALEMSMPVVQAKDGHTVLTNTVKSPKPIAEAKHFVVHTYKQVPKPHDLDSEADSLADRLHDDAASKLAAAQEMTEHALKELRQYKALKAAGGSTQTQLQAKRRRALRLAATKPVVHTQLTAPKWHQTLGGSSRVNAKPKAKPVELDTTHDVFINDHNQVLDSPAHVHGEQAAKKALTADQMSLDQIVDEIKKKKAAEPHALTYAQVKASLEGDTSQGRRVQLADSVDGQKAEIRHTDRSATGMIMRATNLDEESHDLESQKKNNLLYGRTDGAQAARFREEAKLEQQIQAQDEAKAKIAKKAALKQTKKVKESKEALEDFVHKKGRTALLKKVSAKLAKKLTNKGADALRAASMTHQEAQAELKHAEVLMDSKAHGAKMVAKASTRITELNAQIKQSKAIKNPSKEDTIVLKGAEMRLKSALAMKKEGQEYVDNYKENIKEGKALKAKAQAALASAEGQRLQANSVLQSAHELMVSTNALKEKGKEQKAQLAQLTKALERAEALETVYKTTASTMLMAADEAKLKAADALLQAKTAALKSKTELDTAHKLEQEQREMSHTAETLRETSRHAMDQSIAARMPNQPL